MSTVACNEKIREIREIRVRLLFLNRIVLYTYLTEFFGLLRINV